MNHNRKKPEKEHLVNWDIPFKQLYVIDEKGQKLGILTKQQAINIANEKKLDVVIISTNPQQPVGRILDYGKFKYNRKKKFKESKLKQSTVENREVRLTAVIDQHDLETKAKKAREFLLNGDRVKISLKFKGREIKRQELGYSKLEKFLDLVKDVAVVQKTPTLNNNRFLDMYLTPGKSKPKKGEDNETKKQQS